MKSEVEALHKAEKEKLKAKSEVEAPENVEDDDYIVVKTPVSEASGESDPTIDKMVTQYLVTALWSSNDETDPNTGGDPLDRNFDISDIDEKSIARAEKDCREFYKQAEVLLGKHGVEITDLDPEMLGHDFWLSRNGHGTGFFDADYLDEKEVRDEMQKLARGFGEKNPFLTGEIGDAETKVVIEAAGKSEMLSEGEVPCPHCGEDVYIRNDETVIDDPTLFVCPHCGKDSEEPVAKKDGIEAKTLGEEASDENLINELVKHFSGSTDAEKEIEKLRQEITDTLDMTKGRYSSWGNAGSFEADGHEYNIIESIDEAERIAIELVKQDLESEPELFNQDFLSGHLQVTETDQGVIANEEADAYVDGRSDEELVEMADMQEEYDAAEDKEAVVEKARDAVIENRYEEVKQMLAKDPIGYFVDELGAYTREEAMKLPFISIDTEAAAEEAVRLDGWAHFLSLYDGNYERTPSGAVFFKE